MDPNVANIDTGAINIGTLLRDGKSYSVPDFQRDYSWENEQIDQLWDDLNDVFHDPTRDYFMGSIVINDQNASDYKIHVHILEMNGESFRLCQSHINKT